MGAGGATGGGSVELLRDVDLADEITLVGELVVAATASDRPLSVAEIDQLLGLA